MKEITAAQAASYAKAPLFCGPEENNRRFGGARLQKDRRQKAFLVALTGTKNDGNDFAPAAYEKRMQDFSAVLSGYGGTNEKSL